MRALLCVYSDHTIIGHTSDNQWRWWLFGDAVYSLYSSPYYHAQEVNAERKEKSKNSLYITYESMNSACSNQTITDMTAVGLEPQLSSFFEVESKPMKSFKTIKAVFFATWASFVTWNFRWFTSNDWFLFDAPQSAYFRSAVISQLFYTLCRLIYIYFQSCRSIDRYILMIFHY